MSDQITAGGAITFVVYIILAIAACVLAWIVMMSGPQNYKGPLIGIGVGSTIMTILASISIVYYVFNSTNGASRFLPLFLIFGAAILNFTGIILANRYGNVVCPVNPADSCTQTEKNNYYAGAVTTTLMSLVFGFYGVISIVNNS